MSTSRSSAAYGGSGSAFGSSARSRWSLPGTRSSETPGRRAVTPANTEPLPDSVNVSVSGAASSSFCGEFSGRLNTRVTCWWLSASFLPVRRTNGTPCQRSVSTQTRAATNVSVVDPSRTSLISR